ncbi:MAG: SpoIVB peptidase [Bacteroidales bacterium]|nr:SpoIVB peptidase [Bacteroidales bacterium]
MLRKRSRKIFCAALAALLLAGGGYTFCRFQVPDTIYVQPGETPSLADLPWVGIQSAAPSDNVNASMRDSSRNASARLFDTLPLKSIRVVERTRQSVEVCGDLFGIKMFADGALVVGFTELYTASGPQNPAKDAGLKLGDWVVSIDGHKILCNEDIAQALQQGSEQAKELVYKRDGQLFNTTILPVQDQNGDFKAGIWVRDSSAGIGTMTFFLGDTFAGLGHAISDSDTGQSIELRSGEIVPVALNDVEKGCAGAPGELKGSFVSTQALGEIRENYQAGVYGALLSHTLKTQPAEVAWMQEVKTGPAQLICNVDGNGPKAYSIEIEKISYTSQNINKNMMIRVTDEALLAITGGIVQGMSGSPILQDGKLVGAVTHVLVKDPTRGYAVFAQTMLEKAENIPNTSDSP